MKRKLIVVGLILGLWSSAYQLASGSPVVVRSDLTGVPPTMNVSDMNPNYLNTVVNTPGSQVDTVTGPQVQVRLARRVLFVVSNAGVVANAPCSLAVVQVSNKDSADANGNLIPGTLGWEDANGKAGVTVIDNLSGFAFGDSIGGRTIELVAQGSNRIPFRWARTSTLMKNGVSARVLNIKSRAIVSED